MENHRKFAASSPIQSRTGIVSGIVGSLLLVAFGLLLMVQGKLGGGIAMSLIGLVMAAMALTMQRARRQLNE